MKFLTLIFYALSLVFTMGIGQSYAQELITFGPQETKIEGEIPYSVIGKYKAQFRAFNGRITFGEKSLAVQSVYLKIEVRSIVSNCSWCDKIARSRRLLNARRYPDIIFKGYKIIHDDNGFKVKGVLEMHGVRKTMIFPFHVEIIDEQKIKKKLLVLHGSWVINRKVFNIIWNKYLDHGGILVGDYFTVNWGIKVCLNVRY